MQIFLLQHPLRLTKRHIHSSAIYHCKNFRKRALLCNSRLILCLSQLIPIQKGISNSPSTELSLPSLFFLQRRIAWTYRNNATMHPQGAHATSTYEGWSDQRSANGSEVSEGSGIFSGSWRENDEKGVAEKWTKISGVDRKDTTRHARNSFDFPFTGPRRTSGTSGRQCIKDSSDIGNRSKLLSFDPRHPLRRYGRPRLSTNFDLLFSPSDTDHDPDPSFFPFCRYFIQLRRPNDRSDPASVSFEWLKMSRSALSYFFATQNGLDLNLAQFSWILCLEWSQFYYALLWNELEGLRVTKLFKNN